MERETYLPTFSGLLCFAGGAPGQPSDTILHYSTKIIDPKVTRDRASYLAHQRSKQFSLSLSSIYQRGAGSKVSYFDMQIYTLPLENSFRHQY